jgi:DNA-binding NarL/FixJ family response regulator
MHVVLADDHELVREALRCHVSALAASVTVVEAASAAEVLAQAHTGPRPDLILLDLNMPGMNIADTGRPDGMGGLRAIAAAFPAVPVVVVTGYADPATVAAALRSGARGFVPKTTAGKDLIVALRQVLAGEVFVPDVPAIEGGTAWPPPAEVAAEVAANHPLRRVSAREATVLQMLIRGLTNKEIALQLGLKEITIKVHLQHAYRKIGASNRADAVRIILQHGDPDALRIAS